MRHSPLHSTRAASAAPWMTDDYLPQATLTNSSIYAARALTVSGIQLTSVVRVVL